MFRTRVAVLATTAAAGLFVITACGELNGSAQPRVCPTVPVTAR